MNILLATPTYKNKLYAWPLFLSGLRSVLDYSGFQNHEVDALIVDNSADQGDFWAMMGEAVADDPRITVARADFVAQQPARAKLATVYNICRQVALDDSYDVMVTLESDVVCSGENVDWLVTNAMRPESPVVAAVVPYDDHNTLVCSKLKVDEKDVARDVHSFPIMRGGETGEMVRKFTLYETKGYAVERTYMHMRDIEKLPGPVPVEGVALGLTAIHRSVLEKVAFRWVMECICFCDVWFSVDVRRAFPGTPLWIHPLVRPQHLLNSDSWKGVVR